MELKEFYQPVRDQVVLELMKPKSKITLIGKTDLDGVVAYVRAKGKKVDEFEIGDCVTVTSGAHGVILDTRFDKFKSDDTECFFQIREMDCLGVITELVEA